MGRRQETARRSLPAGAQVKTGRGHLDQRLEEGSLVPGGGAPEDLPLLVGGEEVPFAGGLGPGPEERVVGPGGGGRGVQADFRGSARRTSRNSSAGR